MENNVANVLVASATATKASDDVAEANNGGNNDAIRMAGEPFVVGAMGMETRDLPDRRKLTGPTGRTGNDGWLAELRLWIANAAPGKNRDPRGRKGFAITSGAGDVVHIIKGAESLNFENLHLHRPINTRSEKIPCKMSRGSGLSREKDIFRASGATTVTTLPHKDAASAIKPYCPHKCQSDRAGCSLSKGEVGDSLNLSRVHWRQRWSCGQVDVDLGRCPDITVSSKTGCDNHDPPHTLQGYVRT